MIKNVPPSGCRRCFKQTAKASAAFFMPLQAYYMIFKPLNQC